MEILIPTLIVFVAALVIMSVGVIFKRRPLAGTCGGIASMMGGCDICELKDKCVELNAPQCDEHKDCHEHT